MDYLIFLNVFLFKVIILCLLLISYDKLLLFLLLFLLLLIFLLGLYEVMEIPLDLDLDFVILGEFIYVR